MHTIIHAFRKDMNFCVCATDQSCLWSYLYQGCVGVDVDKWCVIQGFFFLLDSKNELQSYKDFQNDAFEQTCIRQIHK